MAGRTCDLVIGLSNEKVPAVIYQDAYFWSCQECGWLGTQLLSIDAAQQEGWRHMREYHPLLDVLVERHDVRHNPPVCNPETNSHVGCAHAGGLG